LEILRARDPVRRRICKKTFAEIIDAMGGKVIGAPELDGAKAIHRADYHPRSGHDVHGDNPTTSVLNQFCQLGSEKPFVTDAAASSPTLTRIRRSRLWRLPGEAAII